MSDTNTAKKINPTIEKSVPEEDEQERLVTMIADDARQAPEQYLRDSEVPKGGE